MGVDLTFCIGHTEATLDDMDWFLAYQKLQCPRNYDLHQRIEAKNPQPIRWKFDWYGDEGIERRTEDPYGTQLTYLHADEIAAAFAEWLPTEPNTHSSFKALHAYFSNLEPATVVVLWWH